MEVFNKPPLTYEQQVNLLLSRGLVITDKKRTEKHLANISYYRLSAYMLPYKKKESGIILDTFLIRKYNIRCISIGIIMPFWVVSGVRPWFTTLATMIL